MTDAQPSPERAVPLEPRADRVPRRRALGLGCWSTGAAAAALVAARNRALHRTAAVNARPAETAGPVISIEPAETSGRRPDVSVASESASAPVTLGTPTSTDLLTGARLVLHVAKRASFGPTPQLVTEITDAGVDVWLDQQLRPSEIADEEVDQLLARLPDLRREPTEFRLQGRFGDSVLADLRVAAVVRAALSRRHLQEVMVDLWHDHLAASSVKGPVEWYLPAYDRDVIRPHALGRFSDLLVAATRSGAMLEYLDTARSAAPDVNENHGRELLELHTVGRSAAFGEADVTGAARVLSGWTLEPRTLTVQFDPGRHHGGPATVLGWTTPGRAGAEGAADLEAMLRHLAAHPATANRISTLLLQRFVADAPPADVVESTAAAYLASGTDLAATLRHVFATEAFRSGGAPLVRRPFDLFGGLLRATSATLTVENTAGSLVPPLPAGVDSVAEPLLDATNMVDPYVAPIVDWAVDPPSIAGSITRVLRESGQPLFAAPHPTGHAVSGARWSSGDALLRRWTLAAHVARDHLIGIAVDPLELAGSASTIGEAIDAVARRCFGTTPSQATRDGALAVVGGSPDDPVDAAGPLRSAMAFLLAAPEMQLR